MVGAGLVAIFFLCTLVVWTVWSLIYFTFVAHYFLTTLTDSSSGQDEVQYPRESIFDWWWKPVLCFWMLIVWLVPASLVLTPLIALNETAFAITWVLTIWFLYPLGLASALYSQNWLHFIHREVVGRMFRHFPAFIYVHIVTFAMFAGCMWLIGKMMADGNLLWTIPAVFAVPTAILLYARHWGRFAWLSLNFLPSYQKRARAAKTKPDGTPKQAPPPGMQAEDARGSLPAPKDDAAAEAAAADVLAEGVREGLPPQHATSVQVATPGRPESVVAGPPPVVPVYDEFTFDPNPYKIQDEPGLPTFAEAAPAAAPLPAAASTSAPVAGTIEEYEDEWSTSKKPYGVGEPVAPLPDSEAPPMETPETDTDANQPVVLSQYYDDKAKKEAEEDRKREAEKRKMPPLSRKTPTFVAAMIVGVWKFMLYPSTLVAWANLAVFTFVELFIVWMLVLFNPFK